MTFTATSLEGCYTILPRIISDDRGWFARTYCKNEFSRIGHNKDWVQLNHSFTGQKGTIRGMHFQKAPFSEIKLVRCVAGSVFDVAVDIRKDSPTFLKWFGTELSAQNKMMLYIPEGFAHGFQALTDNCELIYHHSCEYNQQAEGGIRYSDPMVNIKWPIPVTSLSDRDSQHKLLDEYFKGIEV